MKFARKALGTLVLFVGTLLGLFGFVSLMAEDAMTTCSNSSDYIQCQAQRPIFDLGLLLPLGEMVGAIAICAAAAPLVDRN